MQTMTVAGAIRAATVIAALCVGTTTAGRDTNLGGVEAEGRYGVIHPIADALPNHNLTPGVADPRITQANIRTTICVRGYTKTLRPPATYTNALKRRQIREYGYTDRRLSDFEEDHLLALGLAGDPTDPRNLWPQPRHVIGGWGADAKDQLEETLHHLVCHGKLPLAEAQRAIVTDWISAYKLYVGPSPSQRAERRPTQR